MMADKGAVVNVQINSCDSENSLSTRQPPLDLPSTFYLPLVSTYGVNMYISNSAILGSFCLHGNPFRSAQ